MTGKDNGKIILEATLVTAGLLLFAGFIHSHHLLKIVAFTGLLSSVIFIHLFSRGAALINISGLDNFHKRWILYVIIALFTGISLGILARVAFHLSVLPMKLSYVAMVAPLIGMTEELVFRGIIQGHVRPAGRFLSISFAAAGHTLYKFIVIISMPDPLEINYLALVLLTFTAGSLMGYIRELSKNVLPAMVAHGVFDIILYGGFASIPVWVWG